MKSKFTVSLFKNIPIVLGICAVLLSGNVKAQHCNAHFNFVPGDSLYSIIYVPVANQMGTTFLWSFGDGTTSTDIAPMHTYLSAGTYWVCLTVTDSTNNGVCTDTHCDSVVVSIPPPPICNAHFFPLQDSINQIQFGSAPNFPGSQYAWDFGDGNTSTSPNPSHIYASVGTYYVCLTVTDSTVSGTCTDTQCDSVHVLPPPPPVCNANFTSFADSINSIQFVNSPNGPGSQYSWTFGDGNTSTLPNPRNVYASAGVYYVCLTVTDSTSSGTCTDTHCDSVYVSTPPPPSCDAHFTSNHGNPHNAFQAMFHPALNATGSHYAWDFGDGTTSTSSNPTHSYASAGTYYVCLTVTDTTLSGTCTDTQCDSVTVSASIHIGNGNISHCNAHFIVHQGDSLMASFTHALNPSNVTYLWHFGDGDSSTAVNPVHTYANTGHYTVCLTVTRTGPDSCSSTFCSQVNVNGHHQNNGHRAGMNEGTMTSVSVYPNPMTSKGATITIANLDNSATFKMYDMTGRMIFSKSNVVEGSFTIAGDNITPGLYFYLVNDNSNVVASGRVIVQ